MTLSLRDAPQAHDHLIPPPEGYDSFPEVASISLSKALPIPFNFPACVSNLLKPIQTKKIQKGTKKTLLNPTKKFLLGGIENLHALPSLLLHIRRDFDAEKYPWQWYLSRPSHPRPRGKLLPKRGRLFTSSLQSITFHCVAWAVVNFSLFLGDHP
ncbi:hypothetical protein B0H16DRAFT_1499567 [Mycena metata]|uniref:Uncharacterized protein n=1 Tax=Mycena metata TaxID=1033252 RepID=A0AAD7NXU7_9AGAR|nr:hypothetical protein B0H16DRAFT_1499567 [Mycena metata]